MSTMICVEVVYASPGEQHLIALTLPEGATAEQAILQSGLLERLPGIPLAEQRIGIFSRPCSLGTLLREGDRLEIYRPLVADPKESRRERVAAVRARTGKLR
jgi:hypothetical protein